MSQFASPEELLSDRQLLFQLLFPTQTLKDVKIKG